MASSIPERGGLLQGRLALVTGAASGIGRAIALGYAREGARVVLTDVAAQGCGAAVAEISALGGPAWAFALDVTNVEAVREIAERVGADIGDIDVLVNSAGILIREGIDSPQAHSALRRVVEVNLFGCFNTIHAFLPALRRTRGNIINMSSLVGAMGQLHATTYVATKGAITAFTKALAIDEAAHGVRVNSVSPGNIYTPLWQEAIDAAPDPAQCRADGDAAQILGRMGTTEEAGALCLFIAAEATFTTGVDHIQSGGAELGYGRKTRKG